MKISSVVGARPNFIKLAALFKELGKKFPQIIIHTGQHYDYEMDRIFFDELKIPDPDYHLGVGSGTHGYQVGEIVKKTEEVLLKEKPDLVIVYGDTNSTLGGALASCKLGIRTAHVEAGLRCFDREMPEEINRVLTDHCSDILFCPTKLSVLNLKKEGITRNVFKVGDVMVDSIRENLKIAEKKSTILDNLNLKPKSYILATLHRAENTDKPERLKEIIEAFEQIPGLVFVCHPRTRKILEKNGFLDKLSEKILITPPVGYFDMLRLEKNAEKILTDSGGVQKEAYLLNVPCITLREKTEWVETVQAGWNILVGANKNLILESVKNFNPVFERKKVFQGGASKKILRILEEYLSP
ncbi:MAG: UDP-N-acetylglucosamine 2-epimerase (non-hydrolyzing) [Candidatus Odinarchaeum yellowstonii]|uniref:UDP-N-acetylglucosamine 2-epimerase (Non-hydrolyzing) n=1 Tax=Odinarchaeota yellowstonii (strain LCB_4) TaxID=1841599 RepID=A0AAF0D3S2_ODILC|nr:MAG: UDP-N-acetylglucosamine 2-epimerase (non-hydrolyzing) [Candidatus Odinarchaeum yellowstonii]